ncbi:MAG: JAB domain-containing protein [Lachnospiraceae bacterium]|nr:JAB domain-containing protein [Lachnospiraceae bacterium]
MSNTKIQSPEDAVHVLGEYICGFDREVVCIINLRADGSPLNCNFVSMGAANECIAHPREIFKSAILSNATSMILMHNHPSGNLTPSKEDTVVTDRMLKLCEILGVSLVDHIIVGGKNESYFSFREKQMMEFDHTRFERDYHNLSFPTSHVAEEETMNKEEHQEETVLVRKRRVR